MISVTKIFRFETAHAIHEYDGLCRNIHGHSYELHVTVTDEFANEHISGNGFVIDFKILKSLLKTNVLDYFDHKIILSEVYLEEHSNLKGLENLEIWKAEPSAENIVLFIHKKLKEILPANLKIKKVRLYETADSYAEWEN